MKITRTQRKAARDLAVLLLVAALGYMSEHLADFGVPDAYYPIASMLALAIYRYARDQWQGAPE